jgi:hypothetical protein
MKPTKVLASILLILFLAALAAAAQNYTAFSVVGVQQTAPNVYTATVNTVVKNPTNTIPPDGTVLTIATANCTHVPGRSGENAIVSNGPLGRALLFANGPSCAITGIK